MEAGPVWTSRIMDSSPTKDVTSTMIPRFLAQRRGSPGHESGSSDHTTGFIEHAGLALTAMRGVVLLAMKGVSIERPTPRRSCREANVPLRDERVRIAHEALGRLAKRSRRSSHDTGSP